MAVMKVETLKLRGNSVAGDLFVGPRMGSAPAVSPTPVPMSHPRRQSQTVRTDYQPPTWSSFADDLGEDAPAERAGRSGCFAGVLVRRSPAIRAGRTVLSGWSLAMGDPRSTAAGRSGLATARLQASVTKVNPGRPVASCIQAERTGIGLCQPAGTCMEARLAWSMPAGGMLPASTRGKGA
jgi:hypothetical protein